MNKRFAQIATVGAAALLLSASPVANAQTPTALTMIAAAYTPDMQPYFDQLATAFEAANPDITVDVQVVSWADNALDQKIKTLVQTGQAPDIANLNYFASFAADDLLYTADQIVDRRRCSRTSSRPSATTPSTTASSTRCRTSRATGSSSTTRTSSRTAGVTAPPATWSELDGGRREDQGDPAGHHPAGTPAWLRGGPGRVRHLGGRQWWLVLQGRPVGGQLTREPRARSST